MEKEAKMLYGSDIVLECLLEQGVDTVFGYPGGAVLNIYDSLYHYKDKIRHILSCHEQGACHAADGYARASGKTGVVIATSGPGATNLVTGIATAYMDSIPLVAITGNVATPLLGLDSFQEVDITGITMPITKHNFIVKDVNELADTIRKAFYIAGSGRKGPVLVDIPKDITQQLAPYTPKKPKDVTSRFPKLKESELEKAVELIKESKRPYIYTGGGVIASNASEVLKRFVERVDAPVSTSLMGQGCYDQYQDNYIGMLGMHGTKAAAETIKACDLFIGIGTRFSDRVIGNPKTFSHDAKILHIDVDEAEVDKNIPAYSQVVGDAGMVMEALLERIPQMDHSKWRKKAEQLMKETTLHHTGTEQFPVTPEYLLQTIEKLTNSDVIITTEVGQAQMWAAQYFRYKKPRSFITSGGLGTMGYGLGAAIGAKVANPDTTVINFAGDGSFHMNLNELITASNYNIPIIELVVNNSVLGMVRQWQRIFYDNRFEQTNIDRPVDYEKLAESFGIKGFVIQKIEEVEPVLKEALEITKKGRPVLIECRIDKDINVLPMVPAGKSVSEPIMEIHIGD